MCLEAVSEEELRRIWHKDGYTEGLLKGASKKAIEDAEKALSLNISPEQVSQITGRPLHSLSKLRSLQWLVLRTPAPRSGRIPAQ